MKMRQMIKNVIVLIYTLSVTFMMGKWAIKYALVKRNYEAIGGEYFLIPVVAWAAYKVINIFLDLLDEMYFIRDADTHEEAGQ